MLADPGSFSGSLSQLPKSCVTWASQKPLWAYLYAGPSGRGEPRQLLRVPRPESLSRNGMSARNLIITGLFQVRVANSSWSPAWFSADVCGLCLRGRRPVHHLPSGQSSSCSPEAAGCEQTRASPVLPENALMGREERAAGRPRGREAGRQRRAESRDGPRSGDLQMAGSPCRRPHPVC